MKTDSASQRLMDVNADFANTGLLPEDLALQTVVRVPYSYGADNRRLPVSAGFTIDENVIERIRTAESAESAIARVAVILEGVATSRLMFDEVSFDSDLIRYLARLGAVSVVESVVGPESVPLDILFQMETIPPRLLTTALASASAWFGPDSTGSEPPQWDYLAEIVLTRAYEQACHLCFISKPTDPQWSRLCGEYSWRFFGIILSSVLWPRFRHWSSVKAPKELLAKLSAKIDTLSQTEGTQAGVAILSSGQFAAKITQEWDLPGDDPETQGKSLLTTYLAALLFAQDSENVRRFSYLSDDFIRIKESLVISRRLSTGEWVTTSDPSG